ncbi:MAG: Exodeoxyribonuclease [Thermodesulfobacteriota bacterium]|nr:Exodeoxyribonuclease [Thermodesulfobacteriota bacterium]
MQETKVQDHEFPEEVFGKKGYHSAYKGQKSYNGVAIISREKPSSVESGFGDGDEAENTRIIGASFKNLIVVNTYVPQGRDPDSGQFTYKLAWFERLLKYFENHFTPEMQVVWTGDFNVAPKPIDVYDPVKLLGSIGYHPKEHEALSNVMKWGFADVYRIHKPDEKEFTFWDYRIPNSVKRGLGWRIDHICATRTLAEKSVSAWIDKGPRLAERPSDHTPIVAEFSL